MFLLLNDLMIDVFHLRKYYYSSLLLIFLIWLFGLINAEQQHQDQYQDQDQDQTSKWILVDNFHFKNYIKKSPKKFWFNNKRWLVEDEPENLCLGMNINQYSCHRKENVLINKDGHLEIVATINPLAKNGFERRFIFNSGKISSNKSWLYGRFEMRAILPEGRSLRPVLLLKPIKPKYPGDWLDNGQINALVYVQQHSAIIAGIHYRMDNGRSYMGRKLYTQQNITNTFNRYSIEWTNTSIKWMFNDFIFFEHNVSKPFDQKFYLMLQLGVGGPEFDTRSHNIMRQEDAKHWPQNRFIIDYINVYQQKQHLSTEYQQGQRSSSTAKSSSSSSFLIIIWCNYLCILSFTITIFQ